MITFIIVMPFRSFLSINDDRFNICFWNTAGRVSSKALIAKHDQEFLLELQLVLLQFYEVYFILIDIFIYSKISFQQLLALSNVLTLNCQLCLSVLNKISQLVRPAPRIF